jgi:hypothetical protein
VLSEPHASPLVQNIQEGGRGSCGGGSARCGRYAEHSGLDLFYGAYFAHFLLWP